MAHAVSQFIAVSLDVTPGALLRAPLEPLLTAVETANTGLAVFIALLYLVFGFFVLYLLVQMILRLALIDILLCLAPIALGLWILPHTAGWGKHWLRLFMTTVFQQAIQLIAVALAFAFLEDFAAIAAFEPSEDLVWKLLMAIAFMYLAGRVPSMLGHHGHLRRLAAHPLLRHVPARLDGALGARPGDAGRWSRRRTGGYGRRVSGNRRGQRRRHHGRRSGELGGPEIHLPGPERPDAQEPGAVDDNQNDDNNRRGLSSRAGTAQEVEPCASSRLGLTDRANAIHIPTNSNLKEKDRMDDLTQTISNLVGILLGLVGVVGVGYFIYGAYMYLTASGAPNQMERGKAAMMTALAGIVLALVAYGVVELVMNAVVGNPVDPTVPDAPTDGAGQYGGTGGNRITGHV